MKRLGMAPKGIMGKGYAAVCISAVSVLFAVLFFAVKFSAYADSLLKDRIIADSYVLNLFLEDIQENSRAAASAMATNPEVVRAISRGNREEIINVFEPYLQSFPVDFFTIADAQGRALARIHDPERFGDSLLELQNIRDALNGKTASYIEVGTTIKLSARAGAPVYDGYGALRGAISAGVRLDSFNIASKLKTLLHSDTAIFLGNSILATTLDHDSMSSMAFIFESKEATRSMDRGEEFFGKAVMDNGEYKTYYKPLMDSDGAHFATICLCIATSKTTSDFHSLLWVGAIVASAGLLLSKALMFYTLYSIKKRAAKLAGDADALAAGGLDLSIDVTSQDELGALGRSLDKAVKKIRTLFEEVFHMIAEHKSGNITYRFILEDFQGKFETMAENILDLTNLSVKDRLTGLPNRRSFYSRLTLTRERAIREASPISLMMVDIDGFKRFGFDQANDVMCLVAKMCSKSLTSDVDIVTRWAGDLFIILLPGADLEAAKGVADRIRARVENSALEDRDGGEVKITVSVGVYSLVPLDGDTADDMIFKANEALYGAKESGRNTVTHFERT